MKRLLLAAAFVVSSPIAHVHADEIRLSSLAQGATSSWQEDSAVAGTGTASWVIAKQVGLQLIGSTGYAGRHHRVITAAGAGAQFWANHGRVRPYLRGGLVRAVEQPIANYADDPLGAMLGMNEGTAHRFGLIAGAGVDVGLVRHKKIELFFTLDLSTTAFSDADSGPKRYTALGAGLGLSFDIGQPLPYRTQ